MTSIGTLIQTESFQDELLALRVEDRHRVYDTLGKMQRDSRAPGLQIKKMQRDFYVAGIVSLALLVGILVAEFVTKDLFASGFVILAILAASVGFFAAGRAQRNLS